jgi:hypothetical protein
MGRFIKKNHKLYKHETLSSEPNKLVNKKTIRKHIPKRPIETKEPVNSEKIKVSSEKIDDLKIAGVSFCPVSELGDFIKNKRIAIIANSTDLLNNKLGEFIDLHDVVIRINSYKILEEYTGIKTDIHCCIWLQTYNINEPVKYRIVFSAIRRNWVHFMTNTINKNAQSKVVKIHYTLNTKEITKFTEYNGGAPTSGFNIIRTIHSLGGYTELNLIGFNFYKDKENSILRLDDAMICPISEIHNYEYEKEWIMENSIDFNEILNIITL